MIGVKITQSPDSISALEEQPAEKTSIDILHGRNSEEQIVDFEDDDFENPVNWARWRKWSIVILVSTMQMLVFVFISCFARPRALSSNNSRNFGTTMVVPAVPQILDEFQITNNLYSTLLVSIWELGEGFGPFLIGPLSELYGRVVVYHVGNVFFALSLVASALSINIAMLVAFRFFCGFANTPSTLGPSIVGDLFPKEKRGAAMSIAISIPLLDHSRPLWLGLSLPKRWAGAGPYGSL